MKRHFVDASFQTADVSTSYICRNNFSIACSPVENKGEHKTMVCLMISKSISDGVDERFGRMEDNKVYWPLNSCRSQSINLNDYAVKPNKK
jgi:hypothetical protein